MSVNRQKELDKLFLRLRKKEIDDHSDVDLVLRYLEKYVADPKIGGGSEKFCEFEIKEDPRTLSQKYTVSWTRKHEI